MVTHYKLAYCSNENASVRHFVRSQLMMLSRTVFKVVVVSHVSARQTTDVPIVYIRSEILGYIKAKRVISYCRRSSRNWRLPDKHTNC
jgi:hypothetical protein